MKKIFIYLILLITSINSFSQIDDNISLENEKFRIVVFPFSCDSKNLYLGDVFTKLIRSKLVNATKNQKIIVLERDAIASIYEDKKIGEKLPSYFDSKTATKLGQLLYANYIVVGEINRLSDFDNIDILNTRIINEKGKIENSIYVKLSQNSFQSIDSIVNIIVQELIDIVPEEYKIAPMSTSELYNSFIEALSKVSKWNKYYVGTSDSMLTNHPNLNPDKKILGILHYNYFTNRKRDYYDYYWDETVVFNEDGIYWSTQKDNDHTKYGHIYWYDCIFEDIEFQDYFEFDVHSNSEEWFNEDTIINHKLHGYFIVTDSLSYSLRVSPAITIRTVEKLDTLRTFNDNIVFYLKNHDKNRNNKSVRSIINDKDFDKLIDNMYDLDGVIDIKTLIRQGRSVSKHYKSLLIKLHNEEYRPSN